MMRHPRLGKGLAEAALLALVAGCGGGSATSTLTALNPYNPSNPADYTADCVPGQDVNGIWKTVSNNDTVMPDSANYHFFSYNQPAVNAHGLVVFRARARSVSSGPGEEAGESGGGSEGGESGGAVQRGVYTVDVCQAKPLVYTVASGRSTLVPQPNNTQAMFNEFPSIPRIDMNSGIVATRGQSKPVWTYTDPTTDLETRVGTTGVYVALPDGFTTGMDILGTLPAFSVMQVPNASVSGVKFDQFPGSPSVTDSIYLVSKGNYTDTVNINGTSTPVKKTGVYFRNVSVGSAPIAVIADSNTQIPGTPGVTFGSTAPPSAANGRVVFTGLDDENAPTAGGIYVAPVAPSPPLTPVVQIGQTPVPDGSGTPLAPLAGSTTAPTFSLLSEGLGFDGRYVAFWGAWGTNPHDSNATDPGMRAVTLNCNASEEGNKQRIAICQAAATLQANGAYTTTRYVPINQGVFIADTQSGKIWMVAEAGAGATAQFQDFLYWVFSGSPAALKGATDAEPPRWRSSAFVAVDGKLGVVFKGTVNPAYAAPAPAPSSGIYGANFSGAAVGPVFKIVAVGDDMSSLDPSAPAGSTIVSLGIEREGLRAGWLSLTASSLNAAGESWAGIYATHVNGTSFPTDGAAPIADLVASP
ncbi:MAG: hypothetical protein KGL42_12905 [Betaproteobacteria bacterium]|nr:hypothetical protein [Betaproteobacteria bacterium]